MSDPTQNPSPGGAVRITLRDSIDGVRISQSLIDNASELRAAAIYARNIGQAPDAVVDIKTFQDMADYQPPASAWQRINETAEMPLMMLRRKQLASPPQEYVVHYYAWDDSGKPRPERTTTTFSVGNNDTVTLQTSKGKTEKQVPYVRKGNPIRPINDGMREDVDAAFATIAAQLPGRFRFVEVNDPTLADIQIAAVPKSEKASGVADVLSGDILLNVEDYTVGATFSRDLYRSAVLHEVLHALGLCHPHDLGTDLTYRKPVILRATYLDTQLTYDENDRKGNGLEKPQTPVSLMPSDIEALLMLYPLPGDRRAAMVGNAAAAHERTDMGATVTGKNVISVPLSDSGLIYQPMPDTDHDAVQLRASTDPSDYRRFTADGKTFEGLPTIALEQDARGVVIGDWRARDYEGYFHAATYLQFTPEEIRTSSGQDRIVVKDSIPIYVENNASLQVFDSVTLHGIGNHVSLPASKNVFLRLHGDDYHFTIRNRGIENFEMPLIFVDKDMAFRGRLKYWTRDEQGKYQVAITTDDGSKSISITFTLEDPSPQALKHLDDQMEKEFSNLHVGGTMPDWMRNRLSQSERSGMPESLSPAAIRQVLGISGEPYSWESPLLNLPVNPPPFTPQPEAGRSEEQTTREDANTKSPHR